MCEAFSCLITKSRNVYWKVGIDSHDGIQGMFKGKDRELTDDKEAPDNTFARVEISPSDGNYLYPNRRWVFKVDENVRPSWLDGSYEKPCREAFEEWKKEVYRKINLKEARHLIHPFAIKPPDEITNEHFSLLYVWASVRASVGASVRASVRASVGASVGDSVWASVGASVGDSVRASVRASVGDSVWASVWDSVGAYVGGLFTGVTWRYVDRRRKPFNKIKGYPFRSAVELWRMGLVPSYDSGVWRLHGGKDARVLWEGIVDDLEKLVL